jgi:hypothetical protein
LLKCGIGHTSDTLLHIFVDRLCTAIEFSIRILIFEQST